jgi:hypothetical protein
MCLPRRYVRDRWLVVMVVVVVMVMVMAVVIVIMVMVMVIMIVVVLIVVLVVGVMSYVGGHDTRQAGRGMGMVVAVSGLSRGRSREESHYAEASYRGSSKNESVIHGWSLRKSSAATSLIKHGSRQFSVGRLCRTMCGCHSDPI